MTTSGKKTDIVAAVTKRPQTWWQPYGRCHRPGARGFIMNGWRERTIARGMRARTRRMRCMNAARPRCRFARVRADSTSSSPPSSSSGRHRHRPRPRSPGPASSSPAASARAHVRTRESARRARRAAVGPPRAHAPSSFLLFPGIAVTSLVGSREARRSGSIVRGAQRRENMHERSRRPEWPQPSAGGGAVTPHPHAGVTAGSDSGPGTRRALGVWTPGASLLRQDPVAG